MLLIIFFKIIFSKRITDFLEGTFIISMKSEPKYKFYLNENNFRLINSKKTKKIDKTKMKFEFELKGDGYLIKSNYGYICKKNSRDPAIINCKGTNKYSNWNIHTKSGGVIFETNGYCITKKEEVKHDAWNGIHWNYVHATKCDPEKTTNSNFLFKIKRENINNYDDVSDNTRMLREENTHNSSSSSLNSSSDSDSISNTLDNLLCANKRLPLLIQKSPHVKGFNKINKGNC